MNTAFDGVKGNPFLCDPREKKEIFCLSMEI